MMQPTVDTSPAATAKTAAWPQPLAAYIAAAVGIAALPLIFADATLSMVSTWINSSTFNHGVLIPILAGYLAWRRRDEVLAAPVRFEWIGAVAVAAAVLVWLIGRLSATMIVQQFGLVLAIQALVLCVLGRHVFWTLLFPLFYLTFAIPFGAELVPPLQDITAFFVVSLLRVVGIPVFIDGVFISTPAGNYLVAEACSGLRYLISTIALGLVFANLTFNSWQRRAFFVGLSLVVPIIANGIRAFLIVLIAYVSDNEIATGIDHVIYGWVFFSFVTFLLFGAGYAMREPLPEEPAIILHAANGRSGGASVGASIAIVALAVLALLYADAATNRAAAINRAVTAPDIAGFTKAGTNPADWLPNFVGSDFRLDQAYQRDGRRIDLHAGLYSHERQGAKAVTTAHDFTLEDTWKAGTPQMLNVAVPGGTLAVTSLRLSAGGRQRIVWSWYWIGHEFTGSPYAAKLLRLKSLLGGGTVASAVVVVSAEFPAALGEPTDLLRDMMAATPAIKTMLEKAVQGDAPARTR